MRHGYAGKQLSRNTDERKRLIRNLMRELVLHGSVRTTAARAKAIRGAVEKLITKAKRATHADLNKVRSALADKAAEVSLLSDAKTRFAVRSSGYTRVLKLGKRVGDATEEVLLSFVDPKPETKKVEKKEETKKVEKKEARLSAKRVAAKK